MSKNRTNPKIIMSWVYLLVLGLTLFVSSLLAQDIDNLNQGSIKQESYFQKIPYQNIGGMLIVPVSINGKTYNFCFDTGAPLAISDKIFKELNLPIIRQEKVRDASDRVEDTKVISLPELHLQGITFINTIGLVLNEESDWIKCFGIDGFIGSNMLRNSAVKIDEQSKHIIITNNVERLSIKNGEWQDMKLDPYQSRPFIKIDLYQGEQVFVTDVVIFDTGFTGFYTMVTRFYNQCNDWCNTFFNDNDCVFFDKIAESEGSFTFSIYGVAENQRHLLLNIPKLDINRTIFNNVVITATNDSTSRIGSELLQYGKVTLDFINKRFYFEAFEYIAKDGLSERPWAIGTTWQNDKLVVGIIWDKELESQINLGDEILSINGIDIRDIQSMSSSEYSTFYNKTSSNKERIYELKDIKTGKIKTVKIKRL